MTEAKSLNNIQIATVCTMSDLAKQWVGRKLQSIVIQQFAFEEDEVLVNIRVRISCSLFIGDLFFKKVRSITDSWEVVGMKSHIKLPSDTAGIKFGLDAGTGKFLIQPL
jgi:hypothetical protein